MALLEEYKMSDMLIPNIILFWGEERPFADRKIIIIRRDDAIMDIVADIPSNIPPILEALYTVV